MVFKSALALESCEAVNIALANRIDLIWVPEQTNVEDNDNAEKEL